MTCPCPAFFVSLLTAFLPFLSPVSCILPPGFPIHDFSILTDRSVYVILPSIRRLFGLEGVHMSNALGTKEKIVQVARSQFARNGYHGASMDSIVKGTGLSKGAIYWHFKGKKELFTAVLEAEAQKVISYLYPGPGDLDGGAVVFFVKRGEQYLDALWEDHELKLIWLTLFIETQRGGEESRELSNVAGELLNRLHETLRPVVMEAFPGLRGGYGDMPLEKIMLLVDIFFDGMVMNLGLRLDISQAKECWRFVVNQFINFEGKR